MNTNNLYHAIIPPVPENTYRPLWSVMIPTYNCANYLRETLASVLAQAPGPEIMQIEVIDDYSTKDDPETVVAEIGRGRVGFYRQPQNGGHTKNFETCLTRSRGHLIHLLHGDDCVRDGFYQKMQKAFETQPEIGSAFCRHIFMDESSHWERISEIEQQKSGLLNNWLEKIAIYQRIQTPSMVVRRDVYEKLGGFDTRLAWSEDWEMWVRIAANYSVWYEVEPLAIYRNHSSSNTARYTKTGETTQDTRKAVEIIQSYLPEPIARKTSKRARELVAIDCLFIAREMLFKRDLMAAFSKIKEALKCHISTQVLISLIVIFLRAILKELQTERKLFKIPKMQHNSNSVNAEF